MGINVSLFLSITNGFRQLYRPPLQQRGFYLSLSVSLTTVTHTHPHSPIAIALSVRTQIFNLLPDSAAAIIIIYTHYEIAAEYVHSTHTAGRNHHYLLQPSCSLLLIHIHHNGNNRKMIHYG